MTNEELVIEFQRGGDPALLEKICKENRGLVGMIVKRHRMVYAEESRERRSVIESDDLMQDGYIGLIRAVRAFDPERGSWSTCATWWIWAEVAYSLRNRGRLIRLPAEKHERLAKLHRFRQAFSNEFGSEPQIKEISAFLGVSKEVAAELVKIEAQRKIESLNIPVKGLDRDNMELCDTIPDDHDYYEPLIDAVFQEKAEEVIWPLVDSLPGNQPAVIRERYQEGKTLQEIGDERQVTRECIRQIEQNAIKNLRCFRHRRELRELARGYSISDSISVRGIGLGSFMRTGTSATERAALMRIEYEEKTKRKARTRDKLTAAGVIGEELGSVIDLVSSGADPEA